MSLHCHRNILQLVQDLYVNWGGWHQHCVPFLSEENASGQPGPVCRLSYKCIAWEDHILRQLTLTDAIASSAP